jgi:hypothetical protein
MAPYIRVPCRAVHRMRERKVRFVGVDGDGFAVDAAPGDRDVAVAGHDVQDKRFRAIEAQHLQALERHGVADGQRQARHEVPEIRGFGHEAGDCREYCRRISSGHRVEDPPV